MKEPNKILKYAMEQITDAINRDGLPAQEAVTKVAKNLDLNPNFIKRATEAVNVALSYNHFKKNASAKDADFPIVDYDKVVHDIFGTTEKTAAQLKSEWFPETTYDVERINSEKILKDPMYKKAYLQIVGATESNDSFPTSFKGVFEKCAQYLQKLEHELDTVKTKAAGANHTYANLFAGLAEKFAQDSAYRTSFGEFESQVYSMIGDRAIPYLDTIYKAAECKDERGVHDDKYRLFDMCKEAGIFHDFLKAVDSYKTLNKEAEAAEHNLTFERTYIQQAYHKVGEMKAGLAPNKTLDMTSQEAGVTSTKLSPDLSTALDPVKELTKKKMRGEVQEALDESVLTEGQKGLPHKLKSAIIDSKKKHAALNPLFKEAFGAVDAFKFLQQKAQSESQPGSSIPANSSNDNLDRKLMLQDLMTTDPILSTVEPRKIGDMYQQFLRLAPELSKEKEVVRSSLRTMSSGQALSPFDAHQYIDANSAFIKQRKLEEGEGK